MSGSCFCDCPTCFEVTSTNEDGTAGLCFGCEADGCTSGSAGPSPHDWPPTDHDGREDCPDDCTCIYCIPGA